MVEEPPGGTRAPSEQGYGSQPEQAQLPPPSEASPTHPPTPVPGSPPEGAGGNVPAGMQSATWVPGAPAGTAGPWNPPTMSDGPVPGRRLGWKRALLLAGAIGVIAVCAIAMIVILGSSIGVEAMIIGSIAALLPVPVLVSCFLWLDRYGPEPIVALILCFLWGAFVSTLASLGVNTGASHLFSRWELPDSLVAVLVAPFIEESTKALGPLILLIVLRLMRRRDFAGITDGIVYCGLSATGFAMVENILYLGGLGYASNADQYGPASGAQALIALFLGRILLSGFAHPLFTAMAGIGLGLAARASDRWTRWLAPLSGLLLAMMLHGAWNLMATLTQSSGEPLVFLYGYIAVMMPIFLGMVGLTIWLRGWEGRLTERMLPHYVRAGWLSPPEVAALGTLGRRHSARVWARRVGGEQGRRAMRAYQFAATQLALLRDGLERGLDRKPEQAAQATLEERRLLGVITACRAAFTGLDQQAASAHWDGDRYLVTFPDGVRRSVDPPAEPVVPMPMVLVPAAPPPVVAGPYGGLPAGGYGVPGGAPPPGYGAMPPPPGYGGPPPGYGAVPPPPGYGATPPGYGGPPPGYGAAPPGYGAAPPGYYR